MAEKTDGQREDEGGWDGSQVWTGPLGEGTKQIVRNTPGTEPRCARLLAHAPSVSPIRPCTGALWPAFAEVTAGVQRGLRSQQGAGIVSV